MNRLILMLLVAGCGPKATPPRTQASSAVADGGPDSSLYVADWSAIETLGRHLVDVVNAHDHAGVEALFAPQELVDRTFVCKGKLSMARGFRQMHEQSLRAIAARGAARLEWAGIDTSQDPHENTILHGPKDPCQSLGEVRTRIVHLQLISIEGEQPKTLDAGAMFVQFGQSPWYLASIGFDLPTITP